MGKMDKPRRSPHSHLVITEKEKKGARKLEEIQEMLEGGKG